MAVETSLIGRALSMLFSLFGTIRSRQNAKRWVGHWDAHDLVGRNLAEPMKGAGPTDVSLPRWWTVSAKLTFKCYDCDAQGQPTRRQAGHILIDPKDPCAATRVGRYPDSDEVYESTAHDARQ
jgi:hypothetical protein